MRKICLFREKAKNRGCWVCHEYGSLSHQPLVRGPGNRPSLAPAGQSLATVLLTVLFLHPSIQPTSQPSWSELLPTVEAAKRRWSRRSRGRRSRRRKEHWLPERQNRCQSNSTTCADIKHYCILTFHMNRNSAFSQKPAKWGLRKALCLWAVWGLICDSHITSFHSVRGKIYGRRHAIDLTLPRRCSAVKK